MESKECLCTRFAHWEEMGMPYTQLFLSRAYPLLMQGEADLLKKLSRLGQTDLLIELTELGQTDILI